MQFAEPFMLANLPMAHSWTNDTHSQFKGCTDHNHPRSDKRSDTYTACESTKTGLGCTNVTLFAFRLTNFILKLSFGAENAVLALVGRGVLAHRTSVASALLCKTVKSTRLTSGAHSGTKHTTDRFSKEARLTLRTGLIASADGYFPIRTHRAKALVRLLLSRACGTLRAVIRASARLEPSRFT